MSRPDPIPAHVDEHPDSIRRTLARRRVLLSAGGVASALALAGCTGADPSTGGNAETDESDDDEQEHEELPEGVTAGEFEEGPVPDAYRAAVSLGDEERHADDLSSKADVQFSEFEEAQEHGAYVDGTCCANCADFIPDINGDAFGACAEVSGYIDGEDWCTVYEGLPEPEVPEGMEEDDLATAEVPEEYRTATSQGNEERDPEDLQTHEDVNLTESVDAIAEGTAPPGQSCGNCADFIPDKNGDTWGACAEVEGYIAVEDWCAVWEGIEGERKLAGGGEHEELPEGVTVQEFEEGPVPDVYQSAMSLGGEDRAVDRHSKADVTFSEFDKAQEHDAHAAGTCCANCADYIPDQNGDTFGACAEVNGYIDGADWCTVYEELPEPDVPEGMEESDLATSEVPTEYRTATSQGEEQRDPNELHTHEEVNLMESVEAIEEGQAMPGQSCGNCADFIPDRNGDTWGACVQVEGYIAIEDWCSVWEHVGEEH